MYCWEIGDRSIMNPWCCAGWTLVYSVTTTWARQPFLVCVLCSRMRERNNWVNSLIKPPGSSLVASSMQEEPRNARDLQFQKRSSQLSPPTSTIPLCPASQFPLVYRFVSPLTQPGCNSINNLQPKFATPAWTWLNHDEN